MNEQTFKDICTQIDLINDRLESCENAILSLHKIFAEYKHKAPKPDDQWTEKRLRALELEIKTLKTANNFICKKLGIQYIDKNNMSKEITGQNATFITHE